MCALELRFFFLISLQENEARMSGFSNQIFKTTPSPRVLKNFQVESPFLWIGMARIMLSSDASVVHAGSQRFPLVQPTHSL